MIRIFGAQTKVATAKTYSNFVRSDQFVLDLGPQNKRETDRQTLNCHMTTKLIISEKEKFLKIGSIFKL